MNTNKNMQKPLCLRTPILFRKLSRKSRTAPFSLQVAKVKARSSCCWGTECIIVINEKVNGPFSYISIYISQFGYTNDMYSRELIIFAQGNSFNVFLWTSNVVNNDASTECK